jgi:hypothetical protein
MEQGVTRLNKIFGQVMPRKMGLLVSLFNQITYDRYNSKCHGGIRKRQLYRLQRLGTVLTLWEKDVKVMTAILNEKRN